MRYSTGDDHMIGNAQFRSEPLELVVVHLTDHEHTDDGELLDDARQCLDEWNAAADGDDMTGRQDDRPFAETGNGTAISRLQADLPG